MALSLTLDYSIQVPEEPGFGRRITSREMSVRASPKDDNGPKGLWADPETRTIMLMPLQLRADWLNTTNQLTSVIRLDDMVTAAADISNGRIFEQPIQGNTANPYIYHVPVGPSSAFPSGSGGPPTITGIATHIVETTIPLLSVFKQLLWQSPTTMPSAGSPPTPTQAGGTDEGKYLLQTKAKLDANQALYLRWHQPPAQLNYYAYYSFFIGQVRLDVKATMVEVYLDVSQNGDRTAWKKVMVRSLFTFDDVAQEPGFLARWLSHSTVAEDPAHDRGLLFLPYHRNKILLYSSAGRSCLIPVNNKQRRNQEGTDWDITRSDVLAVKVQTPAPGRFQIQKVAYLTGGVTFQSPKIVMIYTPSTAPTITTAKDEPSGTSIAAVRTEDPTSYTLEEPVAEPTVPTPGGSGPGDQRSVYGVEVTLNASGDGRRTPFFYALRAASAPTFTASAATPESIDDTSPGSIIRSAKITGGANPGDGRMTVEVMDANPFPLSDKYYRAGYPINLKRDGTDLFSGITRPQEVTPLKLSTTRPRRVVLTARDRWQLLEEIYPPDNRDWVGTGHIDAVLSVMRASGIDTSAAITPPLTAQWNTPLGGVNTDERPASVDAGDVQIGWQIQPGESAAGFIKRIAEKFSGWFVGFVPDGKPYYFPKWVTPGVPYFPTPAVTFFDTTVGGTPKFADATFTTEEPEAVVVAVVAGDETDGSIRTSATFVDWAAIKNPAATNFVSSRWRAEVVKVRGTYSPAQLNWIARKIWDQTRRRKVIANFTAHQLNAVPGVGAVVTLGSYGDYLVTGFDLDLVHKGNLSGRFTAELVHPGF